jgi:Fe-S-cluster containining protein
MEAPTLSSLSSPLFEQADHWFHRAHAALLEALPCRKGCCRCCIGLFPITVFDVVELQRGLRALPAPEREAITSRAVRQIATIEAAYPQLTTNPALDCWTDSEIDKLVARFADIPCPALQEDGSCEVYQFRPVTCRTMGIPVETDGMTAGACDVQTSIPIVRLPQAIRAEEDQLAELEMQAIERMQRDRSVGGEEVLLPYGFPPESDPTS